MRLGFVSPTPMPLGVDTPLHQPLGGTESALCYLAKALAKNHHQITLFIPKSKSYLLHHIQHQPEKNLTKNLTKHDAIIVVDTPTLGLSLRSKLPHSTKLIYWAHINVDQPITAAFHQQKYQRSYEQYIFVSHWQQEQYIRIYGFNRDKCLIIRNAIAPSFEHLSETNRPLSLAYTTTPFRGLSHLLAIFTQVRTRFPTVTLHVFSSMEVYQFTKTEDKKRYGKLYHQCQTTPGIIYHGSLTQPQLANRLKKITALAYPSIFAETSCITVLEAMAAGCHVITTNYAALPETTAGFATLVPYQGSGTKLRHHFLKATLTLLTQITANLPESKTKIQDQVAFINYCYTWSTRAKQWEQMLTQIS